jgi:hypothetical protein
MELDPRDLRFDTFGGQYGGQRVGMPIGVRITHIPSGIVTQCDKERGQFKNRHVALEEMKELVYVWSGSQVPDPHPDDIAVDKFAAMMKEKLKRSREKGRGGWDKPEECKVEFLAELTVGHVEKGDPIDVANLCMMLVMRGVDNTALSQAMYERLMTEYWKGRDSASK